VNQKKMKKVGLKLGKAKAPKVGSQWTRTEVSERKQKVHRLFHRSSTSCIISARDQGYVATRAQDLRQGGWPLRSADATSIIAHLAYTPHIGRCSYSYVEHEVFSEIEGHNNLGIHGRLH
jgi:hypothetical protein